MKSKKKQITEIRDDIFFRKLLDVSKNAVFIGWSGVYRKEYQSMLKENLPYLRELSIIENAGFESTNISVALYVFSEEQSDTYISRVYDADKIVHEETFDKTGETIDYARKPLPQEDLRPKLSDFFKTFDDYEVWKTKQRINENDKAPWIEKQEERVEWGNGGNAMLSDLSFRNYMKSIQTDLYVFSISGDISILETLSRNLDSLVEVNTNIKEQLEFIRSLESIETQGITSM